MIETKEHGTLSLPDAGDDGEGDLLATRAALAEEWRAANPATPDEVSAFYQQARGLGADLDAWHALPRRQEWTRMLAHIAQQAKAKTVVDIGCGAGHDLRALSAAVPEAALWGVEPNTALRTEGALWDFPGRFLLWDVALAPLGTADLLICIDVLEHVPDPETFLGDIAQRAPVGCLLVEATATHDGGTPLHLPANRGWHAGRCLETHGWEMVDRSGRLNVWRRTAEVGRQRSGLLLCAYRSVNAETMGAIMGLCAGDGGEQGWRLRLKTGDGMISRSRGILTTAWWRETADQVALFVDDDVTFSPADADHIVQQCRDGHDIICGAYPVHDGGHLAIRTMPGTSSVRFGPGEEPIEIIYAATGFLAIHRRVIDALVKNMPLLHADQSWSYFNLYPFTTILNEETGCHERLSEDWGFCELARQAGFKIWLDPTVILQHASTIPLSVKNMDAVHAAIARA